MGRPRKPTILKIVKGTEKPSRVNPDEPKPDASIPKAPHFLSKHGRQHWNEVAPLLCDMGLMSELYSPAFAMYCQHYGLFVKAQYMLRKKGETETTSNGNLIQSPWVGISNTAANNAKGLLSLFGLTPADISKVSGRKEKEKEDPKQRFFK